MAHDVFISHSSKDKPTADAVCAVLEAKGIRCWVAPRDIVPGRDWGASIIEAIKGARVMVLIFSAHANQSPQINREVERAVSKGIPIIPLRIEDVTPTEALEYFIMQTHWLDAFTPPLERHLQYLAQVIRQILGPSPEEIASGLALEHEARRKAEEDAARLAEEKRRAAKLAEEASLAEEKRKVTEAAEVARLTEERRKAAELAEAARLAAERRRAAEVAEADRLAEEECEVEAKAEQAPPPTPDRPSMMPTAGNETEPEKDDAPKAKNRRLARVVGLSALAILVFGGWWFGFEQPQRDEARKQIEAERIGREKAEADAARLEAEKRTAAATAEAARLAEEKRKAEEDARPKIRVVPDQYRTIQAAIDAAKAGDTVKVKTGVYDEGLTFRDGIRLIGEGRDLVRVRAPVADFALYCSGKKTGFIGGFTFERSDRAGSNATTVVFLSDACSVEITDCRIQTYGQNAVYITDASPKIMECIVQGSTKIGIYVEGTNAHPVIARNQCRGNKTMAIYFTDGASGEVDENICENNGIGIAVMTNSTPKITANQCRANDSIGIGIIMSSCVVENNVCENNKSHGILVRSAGTAPILRANHCRGNERDGIRFDDGASGEAKENACENNKWTGISVYDSGTHPRIDSNICRNNSYYGIWCQVGSKPALGSNQLSGNGKNEVVTDGPASQ